MARKSLLVAFAAVLGMALSAGVAFSQGGWLFGRLKVMQTGKVVDFGNQPLPFTYIFLRDQDTDEGPSKCFMIIRDDATGFFTTTLLPSSGDCFVY